MQFTCIFQEGSLYEKLAIDVRRQLRAVGVDMELEAVTFDELVARVTQRHEFDAVLFDAQIGPAMFRAYQWWHSGEQYNYAAFEDHKVDAALDRIRDASTDADYATGVEAFQKAMIADPPALFLAWGERARAVSRRFDVPVEPGHDIITTLRLWKPRPDAVASRY